MVKHNNQIKINNNKVNPLPKIRTLLRKPVYKLLKIIII